MQGRLFGKIRRMPVERMKEATNVDNHEPFKVWIRWGEKGTQRESYDTPRDADLYEFETERERTAFLLGVNEASGWLDSNAFTSLEELNAEPATYFDEDFGDEGQAASEAPPQADSGTHYYKIYVCYGGQEGHTVFFESTKDLNDEDAIVAEALALGKLAPDDEQFVANAEQTVEDES
jgi:hypothetical protein